ncbi:7001_t:CDS:2 [Diversispora eburnea]|uniref:7001_t:CDS:1 n=1 Tax=Diversispora eburnea TaxID=1213867 RepID=A0A9N8V239_9GLOM|nr:7001_t:CDS:2 [Diversispora eburnea]
MHLTCFSGSIIIGALNVLDFLRSIGVIERFNNNILCLHFIGTSMTAILSCYVLLQVGTNFYQEYNIVKTILIYAPIVVTFGVFGFSVYTAIQLVLSELSHPDYIFEKITLGFSLLAAFLTFLYTVFPLYNIRCLIQPPRILVKKIKRKFLGVEEMIIGGDYRPDMLPKNYEDTIPGPKILHPLIITNPLTNPETETFNTNSNSPKYWKPPSKRSNTTPINSVFGNGRVSTRPPQPPKRNHTTPLKK